MVRIIVWNLLFYLLVACGSSSGFVSLKKPEQADYIEVRTFFNATDPSFEQPDQYPMYPGGLNGLLDDIAVNLQYPEEVQALGIEGTVLASYVIAVDGQIEEVKILQGVSTELDREVLRAIHALQAWKPAMKDGKPIRTGLVQPFQFSID